MECSPLPEEPRLSDAPEGIGQLPESEAESILPQERVIRLEVAKGERAERIDQYLARSISGSSRNKVQEAIAAGAVMVNGATLDRASYRIRGGDLIQVTIPRPPPMRAEAEDIPLAIIYEDDDLLVIDKPAGMVVHPAHGSSSGTLVNALLHHIELFRDSHPGSDPDRPGIVHRLDKDTSGLMVVAKNEQAHRVLARQFFLHTAHRVYQAIVWGRLKSNFGKIETMLGRHSKDRKKFAVLEEGKNAITEYFVLEELLAFSLLELRLKTGRTHQIRVHLQHIGHPVFGDPVYGGRTMNVVRQDIPHYRSWVEHLLDVCPRQALHAKSLRLHHPVTGELLEWSSPLPPDMEQVLTSMRQMAERVAG